MEIQGLQLDCPDTHHTFSHPDGEVYTPPLTGSVTVTGPADVDPNDYPSVQISLIRVVTFSPSQTVSPRSQARFVNRILRQGSVPKSPTTATPCDTRTYEEGVIQYRLWEVPDRVQIDHNSLSLTFHFSIPSSFCAPGSLKTPLGSVSYLVRATAQSAAGTVDTSRELTVIRRMLPSDLESRNYIRQCQGSKMSLEVDLTPTVSQNTSHPVAYSATLSPRYPVGQGPRATERTHLVIKEVRWKVEETVRFLTISCNPELHEDERVTCKEKQVREIASGKVKGSWNVSDGPGTGKSTDNGTRIKFDLDTPRHACPTESLHLVSYDVDPRLHHLQPRSGAFSGDSDTSAAITVEHQVRLDIITGEDTVDLATGNLVDRKPLSKGFNAFFPIEFHNLSDSGHMPDDTLKVGHILPSYNEQYVPAPTYERVC